MNFAHIKNEWREKFGEALPTGFSCREFIRDFWVRIHSLPNSKRYADTNQERIDVINLHNEIADYVLGNEGKCVVFITLHGESKIYDYDTSSFFPIEPRHFMSYKDDDDELKIFVAEIIWRKWSLDNLLLAIADDRYFSVLFANMSRRSAYAPYDGGADLFFSTVVDVTAARKKFAHWVSDREDRL